MIETLARIDGYMEKGMYALFRIYGTLTIQDLWNAGYKEGVILSGLKRSSLNS